MKFLIFFNFFQFFFGFFSSLEYYDIGPVNKIRLHAV